MQEIHYTNIEQQIEKLKSQNLIILDEEYAKENLKLFGYSNLIKSYRDPYIINSNGKKTYRSGVTFEQICSLYRFDKNLRNAVMASMQDLEEHIKEATADVIAESFGTHQDDYLKYKNYQNKKKRKQRFSLPGILDTMKKTLDTDKEPIHYYMENHGAVPPWILFKSIYFSTITNFIDLLKENEQLALIAHLYPIDKFDIASSKLCKLMVDTLYVCMDYRNTAAHGGRIYNFNSNRKINLEKVYSEDEREPFKGFNLLLFLLSLFEYQLPFSRLHSTIDHELTRHCNDFPQDVTYLGQIMNMNIVSTQYVYVTEKSNKYHFTPHCSGIKSPKRISFEEAVENNYIPCKRCSN